MVVTNVAMLTPCKENVLQPSPEWRPLEKTLKGDTARALGIPGSVLWSRFLLYTDCLRAIAKPDRQI